MTFPNSLVDRITPTVSAEDAARLNAASGCHKPEIQLLEEFSIGHRRSRFADGRPALQEVGVQLQQRNCGSR